jgi:hypothetical protein
VLAVGAHQVPGFPVACGTGGSSMPKEVIVSWGCCFWDLQLSVTTLVGFGDMMLGRT